MFRTYIPGMRSAIAFLSLLLVGIPPALAQGFTGGLPARTLCRSAIDLAERLHAIPPRLLHAIGRVESGRADPATGQVVAWPRTINAEGEGRYFDTKPQAVAAVNALRARGVRSIDVGCMQINLAHHPDAFSNLEQAFDPAANADYAARFLRRLFEQTNAWPKATAHYHSATPELGDAYQKRVMAIWPEERNRPATVAAAWGASLPGLAERRGAIGVTQRVPASAKPTGRDLAWYRARPVTWAYQPPPPSAPRTPAIANPAGSGVHFLR